MREFVQWCRALYIWVARLLGTPHPRSGCPVNSSGGRSVRVFPQRLGLMAGSSCPYLASMRKSQTLAPSSTETTGTPGRPVACSRTQSSSRGKSQLGNPGPAVRRVREGPRPDSTRRGVRPEILCQAPLLRSYLELGSISVSSPNAAGRRRRLRPNPWPRRSRWPSHRGSP